MVEPVLVEVCVDSVASATAAERGGAQRVELCSDLLQGGVTPSLGLFAVVRSKVSIALHMIVRPRPGDFCYSEEEFDCMCRDIEFAKKEGADGVVVGILQRDGNVDVQRTRQLVSLARPLSVTFHRAFDMSAGPFRALEDVCLTGADRILTSGGQQECRQGVQIVAQLVKWARGRTKIMAGGRIGIHDAAAIIQQTGVRELHVGLATPIDGSNAFQNRRQLSLGKAEHEFQPTEVMEANVRQLMAAISSGTAAKVD